MAGARRHSNPPASSIYPASPTATRSTRASSIFPYSIARPPTNYSQLSYLQDKDAPPVPGLASREDSGGSYMTETDAEEVLDGGETPLYARSDWDVATVAAERSPRASAYSRSSYGGMTTAAPTTAARTGALESIWEGEEYEDELPSRGPVLSGYQDNGGYMMSPAQVSAMGQRILSPHGTTGLAKHGHDYGAFAASPATMSYANTPGNILEEHYYAASPAPITGASSHYPRTPYTAASATAQPQLPLPPRSSGSSYVRRSTLPSILDLDQLASAPKKHQRVVSDPFADHTRTIKDNAADSPIMAESPNFLTPAAHNRLGRMSVAPARYTPDQDVFPEKAGEEGSSYTRKALKHKGVIRQYLTWRPFVNAALALSSALLLTISLQNNPGPMSRYLIARSGAFSVIPVDSADLSLGVNGWCHLNRDDPCQEYRSGNFANHDLSFKVPGDPRLTALGDILTALTAVAWLHALFRLASAFLHFYLFFALSIPYSHLIDSVQVIQPGKNGAEFKVDSAQAEVDLRVKCERPPFESYEWVWWAWWGHRRSPVASIFSIVVMILAVSAFALAFLFKRAAAQATGSQDIELGAGAYIPMAVLLATLDPFVTALKYIATFSKSWSTFLHPPDPSPAAIMLPDTTRPMTHHRNQAGETIFAPRATQADFTGLVGLGSRPPSIVPPLPGADLDDETKRWLAAYPRDPELVDLIASLRQGNESDDFIISDVGLLYLRPEDDETALLVPPAGEIRKELLEDAHHEADEDGNAGHHDLDAMLDVLEETFWWMDMEEDVQEYISDCAACASERGKGVEGNKSQEVLTAVPFTGVTAWTADQTYATTPGAQRGQSAMAADMAFAMRKAEEEEEVARFGQIK